MKKIIFLCLLAFSASVFGQVRITSDQVVTDSLSFNKTTWLSGFSTDAAFTSPSDKVVPTQKAVYDQIATQIAAITVGITDTAEVIRLIGAYMDTVSFGITASYDAVGDTVLTVFNGNYGYSFSFKGAHQDSLDKHTDSLQAHNVRIKELEDTVVAHNVRLKVVEAGGVGGAGTIDTTGLPIAKQIPVWTDATHLGGYTTFTLDTGMLQLNGWRMYRHLPDNGLRFRYSTTDYWWMTSTYFGSLTTNGAQMWNFNSLTSSSPAYTWESDLNTGINHTAADKFGLIAGGIEVETIYKDSVSFFKPMYVRDTIKLRYLHAKTQYGWLYMDSATHSVKIDSSEINAGFGLTMDIPDLELQLSDKQNGEIGWYINPDKKIYGFNNLSQKQTVRALMASSELDKRRILDLQRTVSSQNKRIEDLERDVELLKVIMTKHIKNE